MAMGRSGGYLREFQRLLSGGAVAGLSDAELLERFAARRDEAGESAFEALMQRHGPMVLAVCHRVLHDPCDAQDAFQATFLVLVRKARSVRVDASLGPWLYGVSVRVARRARAMAARRRARERLAAAAAELLSRDEGPRDDLRAAIDDTLRGLPARYRSAIVLCYLEGLTHEEAAERLACPVGTVRSRLARGRNLLRSRLTRGGLAPTVAAVAAALSPRSARAALPEGLSASTVRAALRLAAGRTLAGVVPAGVPSLVAGVSRTMTLTKLGTATALIVSSLLVAAALAAQAPQPGPQDAPPRVKSSPVIAPKAAGSKAAQPAVESPALTGAPTNDELFEPFPPIVLKTIPATGATDVDPTLTEIRVTFSKEMHDGSWSWVTLSKERFPEVTGKIHYEKDKRTCVLPVKLEPGKNYAISINSQRFANFRDREDNRAVPYVLLFRTRK